MVLNFEQIKEIVYQRFPIIMLDRVTEYEKGKRIKGYKNVTANEWYLDEMESGTKVMPGTLIVESMGQAAGVLAILSLDLDKSSEKGFYFSSVNKLRFYKKVIPGDQLIINIETIKLLSAGGIVKGEAFVDDIMVAECEISFGLPKAISG